MLCTVGNTKKNVELNPEKLSLYCMMSLLYSYMLHSVPTGHEGSLKDYSFA